MYVLSVDTGWTVGVRLPTRATIPPVFNGYKELFPLV
jgi:hypothetical protein